MRSDVNKRISKILPKTNERNGKTEKKKRPHDLDVKSFENEDNLHAKGKSENKSYPYRDAHIQQNIFGLHFPLLHINVCRIHGRSGKSGFFCIHNVIGYDTGP